MIARTLIIGLIFSVVSGKAMAQPTYTDSLERVLKNNADIQTQIFLRTELAREFMRVSPDSAFFHINELKKLADANKSQSAFANYYWLMSAYSSVRGNYMYSTSFGFRAIEEFSLLNDSIGIANSYIALANNYTRQKLYQEAVNYLKKALPIFEHRKINRRQAICLTNLAFLYNQINRYDSALLFSEQSIQLNRRGKYLSVLQNDYKNVGYSYLLKEDLVAAKDYFIRALELNEFLGYNVNNESVGETYIGLAKISFKNGEEAQGINYLIKATELANNYGYVAWWQDALLELAYFYSSKGNYKSAYKYLLQQVSVADSLKRKQQLERVKLGDVYMKALMESHQNRLLLKEQELQEKLISQQRIGIVLGGVSIVILSMLVFYLKRSNVRRRQINKLLNDQKEEIAIQKGELEKLNQTKDKFFSIVAHDLRSPLSSIKAFTSLVGKHAEQLSKEEIISMVKSLEEAVENTIKLTEELIMWAKQQMQMVEWIPQSTAIKEIIEEVAEIYKTALEQKAITLEVNLEEGTNIFADKNQVIFILRNLLNNAVKFSYPESKIVIGAKSIATSTMQVTITDNGIGMSENVLENLFKVGSYVKTRGTAGEPGTGLGLILCKEFILQNRGKIWVESKPNQGSTFYIQLPNSAK